MDTMLIINPDTHCRGQKISFSKELFMFFDFYRPYHWR